MEIIMKEMNKQQHALELPPELDIHQTPCDDSYSGANPNEIRRTKPDYILYDPTNRSNRSWDDPDFFWLNEQLLVVPLLDGSLLATWTSERLAPHLLRIMQAKSYDGGRSWSGVRFIDGDGLGDSGPAAWQVPVVTPSGNIYLFYMYNPKPGSGGFGGNVRCRVSYDNGETWSSPADLSFPRGSYDSDDPSVAPVWIAISVPLWDRQGRPLLAFTRWATAVDVPAGNVGIKERYSHIEIVRLDNLGTDPPPCDITLTPLLINTPITAPHESIEDASFAQEPYMVRLPDDRLFMVYRTNRGEPWYTVSGNDGETWRTPEPMRYSDGEEVLKQCVSPCPVYQLASGDYVFLFNNNDGYVFGAESRWDVRNRHPSYLCRGTYNGDTHQPIEWEKPELFIENQGVPWGPKNLARYEAAAYPSITIENDESILWYPDRKGFLVGKKID